MKTIRLKKTKVYFETLGCSKNQVDTETMIGILEGEAYMRTNSPEEAELIVVNTCGFIESAKEESIETILTLLENKTHGKCQHLIVTGCLAQRYAEELQQELPEVDAILGTTSFDAILETAKALSREQGRMLHIDSADKAISEALPRVLMGPTHTAFLKIAEGCDNRCTYCIIPTLRGKYRSRQTADILREAKGLVSQGAKELIIIAQDITRFGMDLEPETSLAKLLESLCQIEGLEWIRLQYAYPDMITDELIQVMKNNPQICRYIDIPIQHASDDILMRMNRKTSQSHIRAVVEALREAMPDIAIRTTLIVGFPGETESDFEALRAFISEMRFERLGVFKYSREEGTAADKLPNHVDPEIMEERYNAIMSLQVDISESRMTSLIGKEIPVLIEEPVPGEAIFVGRSPYDAPEIDGVVYVHTQASLAIGDLVQVRITDAMEYDLIGETI